MATRIPWDKYETALLIEMYINVREHKLERTDAVRILSNLLRGMAIQSGKSIDEMYRNENGINMRMYEIEGLFGDGNGLYKTSNLFKKMVQMYIQNAPSFSEILNKAIEMVHNLEGTEMQHIINDGIITGEASNNESAKLQKISPNITIVGSVPYDDKSVPTAFHFHSKEITVNSWKVLYVKLCSVLDSYDSKVFSDLVGKSISGENGIDIGTAKHYTKMKAPYIFANGKYVETNFSSEEILKRIQLLLDKTEVFPKDLKITVVSGFTEIFRKNHIERNITHIIKKEKGYNNEVQQKVDTITVTDAERIVLSSDLDGISIDQLRNRLKSSTVYTKSIVNKSLHIVEIKGRLFHEEAFVDWDEGASQLAEILRKLMEKNNGYVSSKQLFEYAQSEMNMFLNDNDINDEKAVYDIAQHLFEKNKFKNTQYIFTGKAHISEKTKAIETNFDIISKFADDQGGIFRYTDLVDYLSSVGVTTSSLRSQMHIYEKPYFFYYDDGIIISAKSMNINDEWKESVRSALLKLFDDVGDHIVLREIETFWFDQLPDLPGRHRWTPLLLQSILRHYSRELGARTIIAMYTQSIETLHAMLVKNDSPILNFGDVVVSVILENNVNQRLFQSEELRQILINSNVIRATELINNMPKALSDDERFAWDAGNKNVRIMI